MLKIKFIGSLIDRVKEGTLFILKRHFTDVEENDTPDFLFYSADALFEAVKYDCVRIFWTGENLVPDFNICDYAVGFHYIDFEDRYIRIPLYFFYEEDYKKALHKHLIKDEEIERKTKFCNFVYSNGSQSDSRRAQIFDLLSKYKKVDSGGKYLNNIGMPVQDKYAFQTQYKFSIAFENSSTSGYTTEKILQAFAAGTIPIYWGNPRIGEEFNEEAFINCHRYSSFEEVVEKVIQIDHDDALFRQYLRQPINCTGHQFPENPLCEYEKFLVRIFSQPSEKVIRRNNLMFGKRYQDKIRFYHALEEKKWFLQLCSWKDRIRKK